MHWVGRQAAATWAMFECLLAVERFRWERQVHDNLVSPGLTIHVAHELLYDLGFM